MAFQIVSWGILFCCILMKILCLSARSFILAKYDRVSAIFFFFKDLEQKKEKKNTQLKQIVIVSKEEIKKQIWDKLCIILHVKKKQEEI